MTDAQWAYLEHFVEQLYAPLILAPIPTAETPLADWAVRGYLTGVDALLRPLGSLVPGIQKVFYGILLENNAQCALFIRGTEGLIEWAEDAEFFLVDHPTLPAAGKVDAGFYQLFHTLEFEGGPLADIFKIVGDKPLTIVGHSLGAALATYTAYELARPNVDARFFASPRVGNTEFAAAVAREVKNYRAYAYELDVVPRVPFGWDYATLPGTTVLSPHAAACRIRLELDCFHHAICYASLLDASVVDWTLIPPKFSQCLIR